MHKYNLQPTIELKTPPQVNFGKCSERKDLLKVRKLKYLQICLFFSSLLSLQFTIYDVRRNRTDSKKNVSFECSEIVRSLPGKGPQCSHLIKLRGLLLKTKRF